MGTCSRIATMIDADMLQIRLAIIFSKTNVNIQPAGTPDNMLRKVATYKNIAEELGGHYLLRYLVGKDAALFVPRQEVARDDFLQNKVHYVTPTPYSPEEAVAWLALPSPHLLRNYVLFPKPEMIDEIWGPRWVRMGGGIEYIIPKGQLKFDAVADVGVPNGQWPLWVT